MKPAYLSGENFTAASAKAFIRYLEQLASTGLYNATIVWVRNVDQKAFYVLSFRILETSVAEKNKSRPWHQTWTLDLIIEAMREIYDPHRFDDSVEKCRGWIRETRKALKVDYNDLEAFRTTYAGGLAAALVDFQEPPADYHKEILADLRRVLTASGNPFKNTQPNQLFQADLDKDCLVDESFKHTPTVDALARLVSARITL